MPPATQPPGLAEIRSALVALRHGLAVLLRHGGEAAIADPTVRDCAAGLVRATAHQELAIECTDGRVAIDGVELFSTTPGEVPFDVLAAAGIGILCLPQGLDEAEAERLVRALATLDPEQPWLALDTAAIPALHWRAASSAGGDRAAATIGLPPPGPAAQQYAPVLARAQLTNLPWSAARLILEDLDRLDPEQATAAALRRALPDLAQRMLRHGDAQGLTWLLEQLPAAPGVPAALANTVQELVARECNAAWFGSRTAAGCPIADLAALAMHLGAAALHDCAAAAAAAGTPLPPGLRTLLELPGE
ncbi:MAG: hypothetical protein JNK49_02495 [Planctomycetes bacterium]|nr:hypothetical protein [Planctomycetota bacterium]